MSSPRRISPSGDFPESAIRDDHDYTRFIRQGLLDNDQLLSQRLLAQASATQTYASPTYTGTNPVYVTTTFNPSIYSRGSPSIRQSQENTWDVQRMSGEIIPSSRATPTRNHPYYAPREESVIPEGAMFSIDIPIPRHSTPSFSDSGLTGGQRNTPVYSMPHQARHATPHPDPLAGQTLIESVISYDDHEIPQYDSAWIVRPRQHPWIRSGRAYICHYHSCNTIVQAKNRRAHNRSVHGI